MTVNPPEVSRVPRSPVTRDRVLTAAVAIADADGLAALTMRSLAAALEVKPMSLYHHVRNKEEILDGIVDAVFAEVYVPQPEKGRTDWRAEVRERSVSMRAALNRHPWALALMESRTLPGPATLRHHDAMLGTLRAGGLSLPLTAHAYAVVDAFVYGFALQEASLPLDDTTDMPELAEEVLGGMDPTEFPHLAEFVAGHATKPGYSFAASFDVGLDLVLDGLVRASSSGTTEGA